MKKAPEEELGRNEHSFLYEHKPSQSLGSPGFPAASVSDSSDTVASGDRQERRKERNRDTVRGWREGGKTGGRGRRE